MSHSTTTALAILLVTLAGCAHDPCNPNARIPPEKRYLAACKCIRVPKEVALKITRVLGRYHDARMQQVLTMLEKPGPLEAPANFNNPYDEALASLNEVLTSTQLELLLSGSTLDAWEHELTREWPRPFPACESPAAASPWRGLLLPGAKPRTGGEVATDLIKRICLLASATGDSKADLETLGTVIDYYATLLFRAERYGEHVLTHTKEANDLLSTFRRDLERRLPTRYWSALRRALTDEELDDLVLIFGRLRVLKGLAPANPTSPIDP